MRRALPAVAENVRVNEPNTIGFRVSRALLLETMLAMPLQEARMRTFE